MKIVSAKCPNCGAQIDVDENSNSTLCDYCNSRVIVEDAIQKFKIELSGSVEVKNMPKFKNLIKLGDRYYDDDSYEEAYKQYEKACELDPDDYHAVLRKGLSKAMLTDFYEYDINSAVNSMRYAYGILKESDDNSEKINESIIECNTVIVRLVRMAADFCLMHKNDNGVVMNSLDKIRCCLDIQEYLLNIIQDDNRTKIIIYASMISTIDNWIDCRRLLTANWKKYFKEFLYLENKRKEYLSIKNSIDC